MKQTDRNIKDIEAKISRNNVLLFDMDGTLVHTNLANFKSYKKAIKKVTQFEIDLTLVPNRRFNRTVLRKVLPNLNETEYEKIIQEKEHCFKEFLHETKLNKKITEILFEYCKTNRTVLVTNCRKDRALTILDHYGLINSFDDIFYRYNGDNKNVNKYKKAIAKLNISPDSIIVFENEIPEKNDAIKAGINRNNILNL